MLNLLRKSTPWMVASLFVAATVFGQDNGLTPSPKPKSEQPAAKQCAPKCEPVCPKPAAKPCPQPCPPTQLCQPVCDPCCPAWPVPVLNAAYNYPARTLTRCPWDVFLSASFIYWQPVQENMEVAFVQNSNLATTDVLNGHFVDMNFKYKPGFKVGLGMAFDYDNWDASAVYTWFHNTQSQNVSANPSTGVAVLPNSSVLAKQGQSTLVDTTFSSAASNWRLKMDLLDVDLGRSGYVGTKLTMRPFFGARAAWIRQKLNTNYVATAETFSVTGHSTSWGVGPRAGVNTNFVLGEGFRLFGNGAGDILYTRYTKLRDHSKVVSNDVITQNSVGRENKVGFLRTHLELEMGLGWGTYWDCNNWYTDIALGYGFQVFYDQNMFRNYNIADIEVPVNAAYSSVANGNLYVHGLTATLRLDF